MHALCKGATCERSFPKTRSGTYWLGLPPFALWVLELERIDKRSHPLLARANPVSRQFVLTNNDEYHSRFVLV